MDFIGKNMYRIAGVLVAAQVFLTFCLIGQSFVGNLFEAFKLALLPLPVLGFAMFLEPDNALREAGYTMMLWAGAGTIAFLGALYGDPTDQLPYVHVPEPSQVSFVLGYGNFALAFLAGFALWMWGVMKEPPPPDYHTLPGASF
jgi:hypothetical protein